MEGGKQSAAAAVSAGAPAKRRRVEPSLIANKLKRSEVYHKQRLEKNKERREERAKRKRAADEAGDAAPPKQVVRTLDNTREVDDTVVQPGDEEVMRDEAEDEFAPYFSGAKAPKLMITTKQVPSAKIFETISELLNAVPNSFYYRRGLFPLKKIAAWATSRAFTHLLVVTEKAKVPNGLIVTHLPDGPTAAFRLTTPQHVGQITGHGRQTGHVPEVVLANFATRLGRRVGRLFGSLFPHSPEYKGRQVVTFHNQRDFIFFRQHRYIFSDDGKRARLQELGPRFTLKLKWLLAGGFDPLQGEYEWVHKRHGMDSSRRKFHL